MSRINNRAAGDLTVVTVTNSVIWTRPWRCLGSRCETKLPVVHICSCIRASTEYSLVSWWLRKSSGWQCHWSFCMNPGCPLSSPGAIDSETFTGNVGTVLCCFSLFYLFWEKKSSIVRSETPSTMFRRRRMPLADNSSAKTNNSLRYVRLLASLLQPPRPDLRR